MKALRIAVYHNLHSGGAKRVVAGHLNSLAERHEVTLYSLDTADHVFAAHGVLAYQVHLYDYQAMGMLGSPFGRVNPLLRILNARRMDNLARRIAADIDAAAFDVVLAQPCQMTAAPTLLRWLKTPSVYYLHEWPRSLYETAIARPHDIHGASARRAALRRALDRLDPARRYSAHYFRTLDRACVRSASRVLTNSRFTRDNAASAYQREIEVCYLGVDPTAWRPAPDAAPPDAAPPDPVVLSVGSLTPAKGFDFLVQAVAALRRSTPEASRVGLTIISNFQELREREYLESLARAAAVPLQILIGVSDDALRDWYGRAACVAYAPVREPFGLVPLEAMASGVPVVAVAEGGVSESVVDGVTGLVAPREPQAFSEAIWRLLRDPALARRLATGARAHVMSQWTWSQHMARLETVLREVARG